MKDVFAAILRAALEGFCANVFLPAWLALILLSKALKEATAWK